MRFQRALCCLFFCRRAWIHVSCVVDAANPSVCRVSERPLSPFGNHFVLKLLRPQWIALRSPGDSFSPQCGGGLPCMHYIVRLYCFGIGSLTLPCFYMLDMQLGHCVHGAHRVGLILPPGFQRSDGVPSESKAIWPLFPVGGRTI